MTLWGCPKAWMESHGCLCLSRFKSCFVTWPSIALEVPPFRPLGATAVAPALAFGSLPSCGCPCLRSGPLSCASCLRRQHPAAARARPSQPARGSPAKLTDEAQTPPHCNMHHLCVHVCARCVRACIRACVHMCVGPCVRRCVHPCVRQDVRAVWTMAVGSSVTPQLTCGLGYSIEPSSGSSSMKNSAEVV